MIANDSSIPHRQRLLGLAYRMLGSRSDAEDVLQDAYLRWSGTDQTAVRDAEGYLVTIVTRLCLDRQKSARARREVYVGPWLPEPILDADALSPETATELADDVSFALLLALERLSPTERAAFLLHDVFDTNFSEVAAMLGCSEQNCRQLASRARTAVRDGQRRHSASLDTHRRLLEAFAAAVGSGDVTEVCKLLADDVTAITDGGGRRMAANKPVTGARKVARLYVGIARRHLNAGTPLRAEIRLINGAPGYLVYLGERLDQTLGIDVTDGRITALYTVRNPGKLAHLARGSLNKKGPPPIRG
jgi:RNA polymerase sigma-70 factor (ECF subfamily)